MFGSQVLEVAAGVVFVYILISIICTAVREGIEAFMKTRAVQLEYGIRQLLHDEMAEGLAKDFFAHPLISSLFPNEYRPEAKDGALPSFLKRGGNLPSYIPSKNFSAAILDLAARGPIGIGNNVGSSAPVISLESVREGISNLGNPEVQRAVLSAVDRAQGSLDKAQANLEAWYDSSMDRVSGWYKRSTSKILFLIGLVLAVTFNVNTISIAHFLQKNDTARALVVARAEKAVANANFPNTGYEEVQTELNGLQLPIGWDQGWGAIRPHRSGAELEVWNDVVAPILGWLLTALAATLGAPFWFDVLNKIMVIRSTVKPHEKSPEESSEDRQKPATDPNPISAEQVNAGNAPNQNAVVPPPNPPDPVEEIDPDSADGCSLDFRAANETTDEDLPAATGGVA